MCPLISVVAAERGALLDNADSSPKERRPEPTPRIRPVSIACNPKQNRSKLAVFIEEQKCTSELEDAGLFLPSRDS